MNKQVIHFSILVLVILQGTFQEIYGQYLNKSFQGMHVPKQCNGFEINRTQMNIGYPNLSINPEKKSDHSLVSRSGIKQRLDSAVLFKWDLSNQNWTADSNDVFIYDSNERIISDFQYRWDTTGQQWIPVSLEEYNYNIDGKESIRYEYHWDDSINIWGNKSRQYFFIYDQGHLVYQLSYALNPKTGGWIKMARYEYTFDANGNSILNLYSEWDTTAGQFINVEKVESKYDQKNNLINLISYYWNNFLLEWHPVYQSAFSYDSKKRILYRFNSSWVGPMVGWLLSGKEEYLYLSSSNKWDQLVYFAWDKSNALWQPRIKNEYIYDSDGNLLNTKVYYWPTMNNKFELFSELNNRLDYNYSRENLITPISDFTHKINESVSFYYLNNQVTEKDSIKYYYSEQMATGNANVNEKEFSIFPNPAMNYLVCTWNRDNRSAVFELINLYGVKVLHKELSGSDKIFLDGLLKGVYIYQLRSGDKNFIGKVLLK